MVSAPDTTRPPAPPNPDPDRSKGWVIGKVAGAPIILTPSWFVAAAVLTLLFAPTVRRFDPSLGGGIYLVSLAFVLLLFISVFLHEIAHAVVGRARGQQVTELAVTLWGGHTAYAGSARRPIDGFLISIVGPLTNIVLGAAMWFGYQAIGPRSLVGLLLFAGAFSNAFVGFFNLLPGLPLDGGQILESIVWAITRKRSTGTRVAAWAGLIVAIGIVFWFMILPVLGGNLVDLWTVMWTLLIAGFLWVGAVGALKGAKARDAVEKISVRALTRPAIPVPENSSVAGAGQAVARAGGPHVRAVLVDATGRPLAVVDPDAASRVPLDQASAVPVAAVATYLPADSIDVRLEGQPLFAELARRGINSGIVTVAENGRIVGVLDVRDIIAALRG